MKKLLIRKIMDTIGNWVEGQRFLYIWRKQRGMKNLLIRKIMDTIGNWVEGQRFLSAGTKGKRPRYGVRQ